MWIVKVALNRAKGTPLPEGPADSVDVAEISQEEPRIAVTV